MMSQKYKDQKAIAIINLLKAAVKVSKMMPQKYGPLERTVGGMHWCHYDPEVEDLNLAVHQAKKYIDILPES